MTAIVAAVETTCVCSNNMFGSHYYHSPHGSTREIRDSDGMCRRSNDTAWDRDASGQRHSLFDGHQLLLWMAVLHRSGDTQSVLPAAQWWVTVVALLYVLT